MIARLPPNPQPSAARKPAPWGVPPGTSDPMPVALWTTDRDLHITYCAGVWSTIANWSLSECAGASAEELFRGRPEMLRGHREALAGRDSTFEASEGGRTFQV